MTNEIDVLNQMLSSGEIPDDEMLNVFNELDQIGISRKLLSETKIGVNVNKFTKSKNGKIALAAKNLVKKWKDIISVNPDAEVCENESLEKKFDGPYTFEPYRDKVRCILFRAIYNGGSSKTTMNEDTASQIICNTLTNIETELYKHYVQKLNKIKLYHLQARSIRSNLADRKNPEFNTRVYTETIKSTDLVHMSSIEMASENKKQERQKMKRNALEACQSDWDTRNQKKTPGQFSCGKCKSANTTYFQLQTRSSDEPMTTFVTCTDCNNRWKF